MKRRLALAAASFALVGGLSAGRYVGGVEVRLAGRTVAPRQRG